MLWVGAPEMLNGGIPISFKDHAEIWPTQPQVDNEVLKADGGPVWKYVSSKFEATGHVTSSGDNESACVSPTIHEAHEYSCPCRTRHEA